MVLKRKRLKIICTIMLILCLIVAPPLSDVGYAEYGTSKDIANEGEILAFERLNPVFEVQVYRNTEFKELDLPDSLRVVLSVSEQEKVLFSQALPQTDSTGEYPFFSYGYIQDSDAQIKFEEGETVLYTILYADGSTAYRVYGNVGDGINRFFACDEKGNITGQIRDIEVHWEKSQYDSQVYDKPQKLIPLYNESLHYDGEIYAEIVVRDEEEPTHAEEDIASVQGGEPQTGLTNISVQAVGVQNLTAYEQAREAIKQWTPTSGNKPGSDSYSTNVTGAWIDYINTIWWYKSGIGESGKVFFKENSVPTAWKWNGQAATETTGNPQTDPLVVPTNKGNTTNYIYDVYSAAQLRYALEMEESLSLKGTKKSMIINIKKDIDFNGAVHNWMPTSYFWNLTINGEGHTLYNLLSYQSNSDKSTDPGIRGSFLNFRSPLGTNSGTRDRVFDFNDMTFEAAYCVCFNLAGGGLFGSYDKEKGDWKNKEGVTNLSKVRILNSLFYNGTRTYLGSLDSSGYISPFGDFAGGPYAEQRDPKQKDEHKTAFNDCYVSGCYVYGHNHVSGFFSRAYHGVEMNRCFTENTILCGTGGHSAGIISCQGSDSKITDCFANISMYSSNTAGGFTGIIGGHYERCFTTGKLEGYSQIGGFGGVVKKPAGGGSTDLSNVEFINCYSTMLVGMRSASKNIGGFLAITQGKNFIFTNCYASGEVGDYSTDSTSNKSKNNTNSGGFISEIGSGSSFKAQNCYYDKQTTAMREWVTATSNIEKGQSLSGVDGVLTRTTEKAGTGLTDFQPSDTPEKGFKGFTNNNVWAFTEGQYPQLKSLNNPTGSKWGDEVKNIIKANSIASVTTIFLEPWDKGYDWSNKGVRSEKEISYARTKNAAFTQSEKSGYSNHVGYEYTYDTVREVISDFTTTSNDASFSYMVGVDKNNPQGKGTYSKVIDSISGEETLVRNAISIDNESRKGTVYTSGVEWFSITADSSNKEAMRPIRLLSFMQIQAGENKTLATNELYDHTRDAKFTMMEKTVDDRIVGIDDEKIWAEAKRQSYPASKKYYEAVTEKTGFGAGDDAWVYTEIWLIEEDGKALTQPKSVRVTGAGTNISGKRTSTEQQWLGELPIGSGVHAGMKFKITYYWMLADGRYRSDSKYVELKPGTYDLREYVYNENGTPNSNALYLGTLQGETAGVEKAAAREYAELLENKEGTHVLAAWEKNPEENLDLSKLKLKFSRANFAISDVPELKNPKTGDKLTITATYYGYEEKRESDAPGATYDRITLTYQPVSVKITYTVKETELNGEKIEYLLFDHEATIAQNQFSLLNGEVEAPDVSKYEKLNLLMKAIDADIDVILVVSSRCNLKLTKKEGGSEGGGILKGVRFCMYRVDTQEASAPNVTLSELVNGSKGIPASDLYLDSERTKTLTAEGVLTEADGTLRLYGMTSGHYYYLIETEPLPGYAGLNQMTRIYLNPENGIAVMHRLDVSGKEIGEAVKFRYEGTAAEEGTLVFDPGDFISLSVLNYEQIAIPATGGIGSIFLLLLAAIFGALAITLAYCRFSKDTTEE